MAQVFDRNSNALARASLVLTGLIVIALGVTLDQLQRSPWVTRQGQRADQPIPFSHKHHVQGLGLQCQYCHTTVSYTHLDVYKRQTYGCGRRAVGGEFPRIVLSGT